MRNKKQAISLVCLVLLLSGINSAQAAFSASDLPMLKGNVVASCPAIWEPMTSRLLYINPGDPQDVVGAPYIIAGEDIWQGNRLDKVRYIAYAYEVLATNNPDLETDYASTDSSIITACAFARRDYFDTLVKVHHVDPGVAQGILDTVRDDDDDGYFNDEDACRDTNNSGVLEGTGEHSIDNYTVDDTGCAAWERDEDGDDVMDHYDYCLGSAVGITVIDDGCKDTDNDGESDRTDSYPHQHNTQCTP